MGVLVYRTPIVGKAQERKLKQRALHQNQQKAGGGMGAGGSQKRGCHAKSLQAELQTSPSLAQRG